jgi:hypothetical protein
MAVVLTLGPTLSRVRWHLGCRARALLICSTALRFGPATLGIVLRSGFAVLNAHGPISLFFTY